MGTERVPAVPYVLTRASSTKREECEDQIGKPGSEDRVDGAAVADGLGDLGHHQKEHRGAQADRYSRGGACSLSGDGHRGGKERDDQASHRQGDLERLLHPQLGDVVAGPAERFDVPAQLGVAHLVGRLGLNEEVGGRLGYRPETHRTEPEGGLMRGIGDDPAGAVPQFPAARAAVVGSAVGGDDQGRIVQSGALTFEDHLLQPAGRQVKRLDDVDPAAVGPVHEIVSPRGDDIVLLLLDAVHPRGRSYRQLADGIGQQSGQRRHDDERPDQAEKADAARLGGGELRVPPQITDGEHGGEQHRSRHDQEHVFGNAVEITHRDLADGESVVDQVTELVGQVDRDRDQRKAQGRDREELEPLDEEVPIEQTGTGHRAPPPVSRLPHRRIVSPIS